MWCGYCSEPNCCHSLKSVKIYIQLWLLQSNVNFKILDNQYWPNGIDRNRNHRNVLCVCCVSCQVSIWKWSASKDIENRGWHMPWWVEGWFSSRFQTLPVNISISSQPTIKLISTLVQVIYTHNSVVIRCGFVTSSTTPNIDHELSWILSYS